MKVAFYTGGHAGASWYIRAGAWLVRVAQKGALGHISHVEAILSEYQDGSVDIGSSSYTDGGVRIKRATLNPQEWFIVNVPQWNPESSRAWFNAHIGQPYDWRGALATVLPGHDAVGWFCNEAVGASVGANVPQTFTPSTFAAMCMTFAVDRAPSPA